MSFIRRKTIRGKLYAYEITSYRDPETKKPKQKSKYLGIVGDDGEVCKHKDKTSDIEKLILDFGDSYIVNEYLKKSSIYQTLKTSFGNDIDSVTVLMLYRLIVQSAMYNCEHWFEGTILSKMYPKVDISSQNISRILAVLGNEQIQRTFFSEHIKQFGGVRKSVIIDATSLPNQIHSEFNNWGRCDGGIDKQIRLLCVLDQESKIPLYYRYLPGNIVDISTLRTTIDELKMLGVESSYVLIDAGYFSEENIKELYKNQINFLSRLPAGRKLFKDIVGEQDFNIENPKYAIKYGSRGLFVKEKEVNLYGNTGYAYIVLDPVRKGKEMSELLVEKFDDKAEEISIIEFNSRGIIILISSNKMVSTEVVESYYMRQSIEQVFGFYKEDIDSLPIRRHNEDTMRGYLFLQFLVLLLFVKLREKLLNTYTVEQAMMIMRPLKAKIYASKALVQEITKKQRMITEILDIVVPKILGI